MQKYPYKKADALAARLAEAYGVDFEYKQFGDGVFISKNDVFTVIRLDMSETEIAIAMHRFTQKVEHLSKAESSEKGQAKSQLKNDIAAVAALGTAASVSGAGLASGGTAVAGSVLWGGLAALPVAPGLLTAALVGSGLYFGRQRLKQVYDAVVPQDYKDKIEGFIGDQADSVLSAAQGYVTEAQKYLTDTKNKQDE